MIIPEENIMLVKFENIDILHNEEKIMTSFNFEIEEKKLYPIVFKNYDQKEKYIFRYLLGLRGRIIGDISCNDSAADWSEKSAFSPEKGGYYPYMTGLEQFDFLDNIFTSFSQNRAREICYKFKIPLEIKMRKLPDFQRKLIMISALLATDSSLLLLEEPLAKIPGGEAVLLLYLLREELEKGRSILFTIQEDKLERYEFDRFYTITSDGLKHKKINLNDKQEVKKQKDGIIKKIPVWDEEKAFLIDHKEIKWISTYKGKSTLHTGDGEYNVNMLLCDLEERLDSPPFLRCHRSYIVNLNQIEEVVTWFNGTYNLKIGKEDIPVSRSKAKELEKTLGI